MGGPRTFPANLRAFVKNHPEEVAAEIKRSQDPQLIDHLRKLRDQRPNPWEGARKALRLAGFE